MVTPERRLGVFQIAVEVAAFYWYPPVDRQQVIDALHEAARQGGLYDRHGVNIVQRILADAFARRDSSITTPVARNFTSDIREIAA